ncbi:Transcription factor, partial [Coemansia sp. RSA 2603]
MSEALQQGNTEGVIEPKAKKKTGSADGKRAKRQKVSKACVFCQRSHMSCDDKRPCQRCIKRNISHMCRDKEPTEGENSDERKGEKAEGTSKREIVEGQKQKQKLKPKPKPKPNPKLKIEPSVAVDDENGVVSSVDAGNGGSVVLAATAPEVDAGSSGNFDGVDATVGTPSVLGYVQQPYINGIVSGEKDRVSSLPIAPAPASVPAVSALSRAGGMRFDSNSLLLFGNDVASNEFSALNEFLESLQRGTRGGDRGDSDWIDGDVRLSNPPSSSPSEHPTFPAVGSPAVHPPYGSGRTLSLPTVSQLMAGSGGEGVTQTERFLLTAADPNDGTSEDKLR